MNHTLQYPPHSLLTRQPADLVLLLALARPLIPSIHSIQSIDEREREREKKKKRKKKGGKKRKRRRKKGCRIRPCLLCSTSTSTIDLASSPPGILHSHSAQQKQNRYSILPPPSSSLAVEAQMSGHEIRFDSVPYIRIGRNRTRTLLSSPHSV